MRKVTEPDLSTLLVMAFRYALGRQSTAPTSVESLLAVYGDVLQPWQREQIARDIRQAIAGGFAGATCDVEVWQRVAERMDPGARRER